MSAIHPEKGTPALWRRRSLLLFLAAAVLCVVPARAAPPAAEDIGRWFTYYYLEPQPAAVPDAVTFLSRSDMLDDNKRVPPIFGFLSGVFHDNPQQLPSLVRRLESIEESHLVVVAMGLWYADLPSSREQTFALLERHPVLKQELAAIYESAPKPVEAIPLERGPWVLDALWGKFMATGEERPVLRVIEALQWAGKRTAATKMVVGSAAQWSLTSNAIQHPRVLTICEQQIGRQPEDVAATLREVVKTARRRLAGDVKE